MNQVAKDKAYFSYYIPYIEEIDIKGEITPENFRLLFSKAFNTFSLSIEKVEQLDIKDISFNNSIKLIYNSQEDLLCLLNFFDSEVSSNASDYSLFNLYQDYVIPGFLDLYMKFYGSIKIEKFIERLIKKEKSISLPKQELFIIKKLHKQFKEKSLPQINITSL